MVKQAVDDDMAALYQPHFDPFGFRPATSVCTDDIHGPPAFTSARATTSTAPSRVLVFKRQPLKFPSRRAAMHFVRGRTIAPRSAASRALRTTRRASSTQQSEYSNARRYSGFRASPANPWPGRCCASAAAGDARRCGHRKEAEPRLPATASGLCGEGGQTSAAK